MSENPYEPPQTESSLPAPSQEADDLRAIASYSLVTQWLAIVHVAYWLTIAIQSRYEVFPFASDLRIGFVIEYIILVIASGTFAILLGLRVHHPAIAILLGLASIVPCFGSAALIEVTIMAWVAFVRHRIPFNLFGADRQALEKRISQLESPTL